MLCPLAFAGPEITGGGGEVDSVVGAVNGIVVSDGAGNISAATSLTVDIKRPIDSTPDSDHSWSGLEAEFKNGSGSTVAFGSIVYIVIPDAASQAGELWPWDADRSTFKYYKPIGVVIEEGGIQHHAIGTVGIGIGIFRDDTLAIITDNTDEGKTIYGTVSEGVIDDVAPASSGDVICAVGIALDDKVIYFNFGLCTSEEVP